MGFWVRKHLLVILILLVCAISVFAISSTNYAMDSYVISSGGGVMSSGNYSSTVIVGTISGVTGSQNYETKLGFFYGGGSSTSTTSSYDHLCISCSDCNSEINNANSGETVNLTTSIIGQTGTCIDFGGKDNIIFNCIGNTINGDDTGTDYGILFSSAGSGSNSNTVKNCFNISGFYTGVYSNVSNYNNLTQNNIYANTAYGVYLLSSNYMTLLQNNITTVSTGVDLKDSNNNTITSTRITSQANAVLFQSQSQTTQNKNTGLGTSSNLTNDSSVGNTMWINTTNASTNDNIYATATPSGSNLTYYLKAQKYGFNIPTGVNITGIEATVEHKKDSECTGGNITYSGGYTIHTFTINGTFNCTNNETVEYLVIAGGGGSGSGGVNGGGGGGAGGYKNGTGFNVTAQSYSIIVGNGGAAGSGDSARGLNGYDSTFSSITSTGGGGGGARVTLNQGLNGGSGGGAGANPDVNTNDNGGTASPAGQGNNGGIGYRFDDDPNPIYWWSGGGGGAGSVAGAGSSGTYGIGGTGGNGLTSSITGSSITRAGGGGGGGGESNGVGGSGGGGGYATSGTANTGGGGGTHGGNGGSGIVIIRYLTPNVTDYKISIVKSNGTIGSTNRANSTSWSVSDENFTYGSSFDLWGENWTAPDINNANFGVAISVNASYATAYIDIMTIKVYYNQTSYLGSNNNTFTNSIISGSTSDFNLTSDSTNNYAINTSFNKNNVFFDTSTSNLLVQWYLDVFVNDSIGALTNAVITAYNNSNSLVFTKNTTSGWITTQTLTEYVQDANGKTFSTNYTINATYNASYSNLSKQVNLTASSSVYFNFIGQNSPIITFVNSTYSVWTLNAGPTATTPIEIYFEANDVDGVSDLNDATASVILNLSGEANRTASCTRIASMTSTKANYTCTVNMKYYDSSGNWMINASISDNGGRQTTNTTAHAYITSGINIILSQETLTWTGVASGQFNKTANAPINISNVGNININNITIKAYDLLGPEFVITASNFSASSQSSTACLPNLSSNQTQTISYTTGYGTSTNITNDNFIGDTAWTNTSNASVNDNIYATATPSGSNSTNYLKTQGYGFSIPTNANITGIEVLTEHKKESNNNSTGGNITTILVNGINYTVHTFKGNGTFTPSFNGTVEYLVVGGGGGGGAYGGGGGGAGGFRNGTGYVVISGSSITITVGNGGAPPGVGVDGNGENGSSSIFGSIIATGGGGGGGGTNGEPPLNGGSGGGSSFYGGTPGTPYPGANGTSGQGYNGGSGYATTGADGAGGGGGGAGGPGVNGHGDTPIKGGDGGNGSISSINGTSVYYAGGGGATTRNGDNGVGGLGGGGIGFYYGTAGTPNTGGGGGAADSGSNPRNGAGGSGIVIIRYITPDVKDNRISIVKSNGTIGSTNKANSTSWSVNDENFTYGNSTELWGENWTPSDINNANFGVAISVNASYEKAYFDYVTIKVYYNQTSYLISNITGTRLLNNTDVNIIGASIQKTTYTTETINNQSIYYCMPSVPTGMPSGTYTQIQTWVTTATG